jgi:hypothetical protein
VIGFLGRVRGVDFAKTTMVTWKKAIDSSIYTYNQQSGDLRLFGLVTYHTGGLDDQNNIKKFNSAEYGLIAIDQAEEASRDQIALLRGTQGRSKINGVMLPRKALFTENPANSWFDVDFNPDNSPSYPPRPANRVFIQALPSDNEFIPVKPYIDGLKEAWKHRPEIIDAYVYGKRSGLKGGLYFFKRDWLEKSSNLQKIEIPIRKSVIACDPAWLGEITDDNVIYQAINNYVAERRAGNNEDFPIQALAMMTIGAKYNANTYIIDSIGVGAGVWSEVNKIKKPPDFEVIACNTAKSPINSPMQEQLVNDGVIPETELPTEKFFNLRSQIWWEGAEDIASHRFKVPIDERLWAELLAVQYDFRNGKIIAQDKREVRSKINRSTNEADAFLMMLFALKRAKQILPRDYVSNEVGMIASPFCKE